MSYLDNETIKDILETVTNGKAVLQVTTTPCHVVVVGHVHAPMFESPDFPDQSSRDEFIERAFEKEVKRRGVFNESYYEKFAFVGYPTCMYEKSEDVRNIFKTHYTPKN